MGLRVLATFSLLALVHLINIASSYPINNNLPSEFVQKSKLEDKAVYGSKMEGGGTHGGGGGAGHGGQSHGGGAVIPVYAAGAANKNHNHRSAANCNLNKINFSSMLMMIFVYPLMLICLLT